MRGRVCSGRSSWRERVDSYGCCGALPPGNSRDSSRTGERAIRPLPAEAGSVGVWGGRAGEGAIRPLAPEAPVCARGAHRPAAWRTARALEEIVAVAIGGERPAAGGLISQRSGGRGGTRGEAYSFEGRGSSMHLGTGRRVACPHGRNGAREGGGSGGCRSEDGYDRACPSERRTRRERAHPEGGRDGACSSRAGLWAPGSARMLLRRYRFGNR